MYFFIYLRRLGYNKIVFLPEKIFWDNTNLETLLVSQQKLVSYLTSIFLYTNTHSLETEFSNLTPEVDVARLGKSHYKPFAMLYIETIELQPL